MNDTYRIEYRCSNCGHVFNKIIKKGEAAPDSATCKSCGCLTGKKRAFQPSREDRGLVDYYLSRYEERHDDRMADDDGFVGGAYSGD